MRRRRRRANAENPNQFYHMPAAALTDNPAEQTTKPRYALRISLARCITYTLLTSILLHQLVGPLVYLLFDVVIFKSPAFQAGSLKTLYAIMLVFDWLFIVPFTIFLLAVMLLTRYSPHSTTKRPPLLALWCMLFAIVYLLVVSLLTKWLLLDNVRLGAMISMLAATMLPAAVTGYFVAGYWQLREVAVPT